MDFFNQKMELPSLKTRRKKTISLWFDVKKWFVKTLGPIIGAPCFLDYYFFSKLRASPTPDVFSRRVRSGEPPQLPCGKRVLFGRDLSSRKLTLTYPWENHVQQCRKGYVSSLEGRCHVCHISVFEPWPKTLLRVEDHETPSTHG